MEKPDHRILAITQALQEKNKNETILVSKDINCIKACSLGILCRRLLLMMVRLQAKIYLRKNKNVMKVLMGI